MARATITPGPGPFVFGETYTADDIVGSWTPKAGKDLEYWCLVEVRQHSERVVGAGYLDLTPPAFQTSITLGPTPSWPGGAATGRLTLRSIENNRWTTQAVSDDFEVLP